MANVNDPQNYEGKIKRVMSRVQEDEDIDENTTEAIEDFADAQIKGEVPDDAELATSTLYTYLQGVEKLAHLTDSPLPQADVDEIEEALDYMARRYSASYHNNALDGLYAFSDYHELELRGEWEVVDRQMSKVDLDRLFTDEEVTSLIDTGDIRDKMMVGIFADTGCCVGALCSFRIRDLYLDGDIPQLAFNTDAPTKTADGKVLLTWSLGHIETYLSSEHPRPNDPNAPVLHKKEQYEGDDDDGALHPSTVREILKDLGEEVGIPRDRMKPHNFRHTAVSNWIRQGWNVKDIVHRASWAGPEMLEVYDNVTDEMRNEDLALRLGLVDDEDVATDPSEATIECPRCDTPVRRDANFCGKCSLQMSRAPALEEGTVGSTSEPDAMPGKIDPDELWSDGAGDVIGDVPTDRLLKELVERGDVDPTDLVE